MNIKLLLGILSIFLFSISINAQVKPKQADKELQAYKARVKADPLVTSFEFNDKHGTPAYIRFDGPVSISIANAEQALAKYLPVRRNTDELSKIKDETMYGNIEVQRYQQYFKGVRIEHGSYVVVAKDGKLSYITGEFFQVDASTSIAPVLTEDAARTKARIYLDGMVPANDDKPAGELVFIENGMQKKNADGKVHLAYRFEMGSRANASKFQHVYVDAATGDILFTNLLTMMGCFKDGHSDKKNDLINKEDHATEKRNMEGSSQVVSPLAASIYSGTLTNMVTRFTGGSYRLEATIAGENYPTHIKNILHAPVSTYTLVSQFTAAMAAATEVTDADNSWTAAEYNNANHDNTALDVQWGAQRVYDYWKTRHTRNSWDNANGILNCYVHADNNWDNAFWQGGGGINSMFYGDGSYAVGGFSTLSSLDVTGHEIGHGVCQATSNLTYSNESGAMNEGFSDIWGASIEHYGDPFEADAVPKSYFDIGEEITIGGGALRSMSNPKLYGQPDTYLGTNWYTGAGDNGGVHTNSGVLNYWFYLLVNGKTVGTNDLGNTYSVPALGWVNAEKIVFLGETSLTSSSNYSACRTAMINAATTLFGACPSLQVEAVTRAWYAVGVGADFAPCTPQILFNGAAQTVTETGSTGATCLKTKTITVPVKIAQAATQSATVSFTISGTATNGANADYTISPSTVVFPASSTAIQNLTITINNDAYVEGTETILLHINSVTTSGNAVAGNTFQDYIVTITDDDYAPSQYILTTGQTIYSENFTAPVGFTQATSGGAVNFWRLGNNAGTTPYFTASNNCAYVSQNTTTFTYSTTSTSVARLQTPVINASNATNLQLTYDYVCNGEIFSGTIYDYGTLWYSTNSGTSWSQINSVQYQGITTKTTITVNLPAGANNAANLMLGFRWDNDNTAGNQPPFGIDNIVLKGDIRSPAPVQSSVNTGTSSDQQYLGPNATVNFFDKVSNSVMGTIQNLSSFDYGCTTFEVDRAGTSALFITGDVSGNNKQRLSSKTFKVTPTTNSSSGNYRITLYYSAAEKAGYEATSTRVWVADNGGNNGVQITKSPGAIGTLTASSANARIAIESVGTYGTDYTITASFTNGFSGFAAGIPPLTALPVTLVDFNAVRNGSTVLVKWKVNQQIDMKQYEVEHSANGINYTSLGTVAANNSTVADYNFTDIHPVPGMNYYRLKMTGRNGAFSYSHVATVEMKLDGNSLVVSPNPVLNRLIIQYTSQNAVQLISVFNEQGIKVREFKPGNQIGSIPVDATGLTAGLYFVRMTDSNNQVITQKFMKQ